MAKDFSSSWMVLLSKGFSKMTFPMALDVTSLKQEMFMREICMKEICKVKGLIIDRMVVYTKGIGIKIRWKERELKLGMTGVDMKGNLRMIEKKEKESFIGNQETFMKVTLKKI